MKRYARALLTSLASAALLIWIAVMQVPDGRLHAIFLDTDGGQGILLRTPSGRYALIDGGSHSSQLMAALGRHLPFWQRTLHAVIATHQGSSALLPLIDANQRYRVITAVGPGEGNRPSSAYRRWRDVLDQRQTPFVEAQVGTILDLGDNVQVQVIAAGEHLALLICHNEVSVLLPGSEQAHLPTMDATVIAFPASPKSQVQLPPAINASAVILFTGGQQSVPSSTPTPASIQLLSTSEIGSVEVVSDGQHMEIHPAR